MELTSVETSLVFICFHFSTLMFMGFIGISNFFLFNFYLILFLSNLKEQKLIFLLFKIQANE